MAGLILIGLYLLPSVVAATRKVANTGSVVIINIFLGWTLIGWVVALAMALRDNAGLRRLCPSCGERVKAEASVCRFCNRPLPAWLPPSNGVVFPKTKAARDEAP